MSGGLTVVLDVGKTLTKLSLWDRAGIMLAREVRPNQRVLSGALLLLVMNFIGLGLGPTYVGAASTWLKEHDYQNTLQLALYSITPFYLLAIFLFLWLARILRAERKVAA